VGPALTRRSLAPHWPLALADSPRAPFWLARFLEAAGGWLFLVWLLIGGWTLNPDPRASGLFLGAWLVGRPLMALIGPRLPALAGRGPTALVLLARAAIVVAAVVLGAGQFELLLVAALAFGALNALADAARPELVDRLFAAPAASVAGSFDALISRLALVAGPLGATVLLLIAPALAAWAAALVLATAALIMLLLVGWERRTAPARRAYPAEGDATTGDALRAHAPSGGGAFLPLVQPRAFSYLAAAFVTGALMAGLLALLPQLTTQRAVLDGAFVGAAIGLVGLGALGLRLPMIRLRARLQPALLLAVLVWALALTAALIGLVGLVVGVPLLVIVGGLATALNGEQLIGLRRIGGEDGTALRNLLLAFALGQLAGATKIAILGSEPQLVGGPLVMMALASSALIAFALFVDRHSLSALRHQVQQFAWDADPLPRAFEQPPPRTRQARLADWLHRQVETELVDVTLPVSGRHYAIARPSGDGRDSLFEAAKADAERQMPYWAKVWPSGVALADAVVERAAEVKDRHVLELGAGLGVTACAVLEEGGQLLTADYSLLPLALCRYNGLANTGRATGSICFNWRDEEQVREVLHRHPPIGLILAADVLYEGRDVMPLVHVIERLLAPTGELWLAEPVRRTAQRFLDLVAELGWQVDSRRVKAAWPDATDGWVNVHVICRERLPAEAAVGLGAWQL
jgi:predicted nicotinamide N-methyase/MFS family permease